MVDIDNIDEYLDEIQILIGQGKLDLALEKLRQIGRVVKIEEEVLQISHAYNHLLRDEIKGTINSDEKGRRYSNLVSRLLAVCKLAKDNKQKHDKQIAALKKLPAAIVIIVVVTLTTVFVISSLPTSKSIPTSSIERELTPEMLGDVSSIGVTVGSNDLTQSMQQYQKTSFNLNPNGNQLLPNEIQHMEVEPNLSSTEYFKRGMTIHRDQPYRALQYFNRALVEDETNARVLFQRGILNRRLGRIEEALEDYSRALVHDKSRAEIYVSRSTLYIAMEQYEEAERDCAMASSIDNSLPELHLSKGEIFLRKGMYEESILALKYALQKKKFYRLAINRLSIAYYLSREDEKFCELLKQFEKLNCIYRPHDIGMICGTNEELQI